MRNLLICCFISTCGNDAGTIEKQEIMASPAPQQLYRIVSPEEWQRSQKMQVLETPAFDKDFIHLSTKEQLPQIAKKFWNGKDYFVLTLDTSKLQGRLVYEANPGGKTLYYHLYDGCIPLEAVIDVSKVSK